MIEICICPDNNYAMPAGVCVTSIFENNKDEKIRVHIITEGISQENEAKFQKTAEKYGQLVEIHTIDASAFDTFPVVQHFSKAMYLRYLVPQILPADVNKALYLDCDIICVDNIQELWDTDLGDTYCGVVPDGSGDNIHCRNRMARKQQYLQHDDIYFNSGVMLMNLKQWREKNLANQLTEFIAQNKEICDVCPDQDPLNILFVGHVTVLDFRYNMQELCLVKRNLREMRLSMFPQLDHALSHPCIIHYTTYKPWNPKCRNPYKEEFFYYRRLSSWPTSISETFKWLPQNIRRRIGDILFSPAYKYAHDLYHSPRL